MDQDPYPGFWDRRREENQKKFSFAVGCGLVVFFVALLLLFNTWVKNGQDNRDRACGAAYYSRQANWQDVCSGADSDVTLAEFGTFGLAALAGVGAST